MSATKYAVGINGKATTAFLYKTVAGVSKKVAQTMDWARREMNSEEPHELAADYLATKWQAIGTDGSVIDL